MEYDEPVPPPIIDLTEVKVDIGALDDFVSVLQGELDSNLEPYSNEIIADHREGVPLGQYSASVPLSWLRADYYRAQQTAIDGLRSYVEATQVLARAVELLADYYRNADAMAVARSADVMGAIGAAQNEMNAMRAAELERIAAEQVTETARENGRVNRR